MKIGFLNPWQNAAENQIFQSLAIAAARIGHELAHCANSMEVAAHAPDFVLACSSMQPKLNDVPTYAAIHTFRDLYLANRPHYDNILSCDGYLTISDSLARFIRDLTFAAGRPQEAGFFYLTCQRLDISADLPTLIASRRLKIAYCGTNWDAQRAELITLLGRHDGVRVFGPEQSWSGLDPKSYGGMLPFDGKSVQQKYAENGIGLCLLSEEHYRDDVVSNRLFEVASAGAIAICPDIPWVRRHFGDSLYYIDQSLPHPYLVRQILLRREEIYRDPAAAIEKARRAREIFERHFAAEVLLENAVAYHHRVSAQRQSTLALGARHAPLISVIVRCGSRPLEFVRRAVESIARQSYGRFDVILVRHSDMDLSALISLSLGFPNIESIRVIDAPAGKRSTSLWAGLVTIKGEYFAILDDDDWNFSNHFETLFHPIASPPPDRFFGYSGVIAAQPDPAPIEGGGSDNRRLAHFGITSTDDLFAISGVFTPNCFVASSNLLDPALLEDPQLATCEDSYLILSLLAQADPKFSNAATAVYESGRPGQSGFAHHPLRFEDELTVQIRLHGCALPRPGLAAGYAALSEFWKRRPAAKAPRIPAELIERIATGFHPKTSNIRPGCRVVNPQTGECVVETPPQPWSYAAELSLGIPAGREGPGFIRVEILVTRGPIGIGILNPAATDFLFRIPLGESEERQSVDLPVAGFHQIGRLVIQNWDMPGAHAASIGSLTAWALRK
jgi:phosphoglycerol transferase